nr:MAG TPA: hypothetical protein [Caudoviricetes sp.]
MAVEVNREQLVVTSIEQLKQYAQGEVIELPPFAPTQPFVAKLKRPSLLAMAKNGKIPNELLVKTNELFMNDGTAVNASDDNMLKEIFSVIDTIAGEVFVQPTYKEIKEAGIELTDEQMLFIFNYTQTGVKNLENFRED